jgi:hypothetical protein
MNMIIKETDVHTHEHAGKHGPHEHKHPGHEKEIHKHKDVKKKTASGLKK